MFPLKGENWIGRFVNQLTVWEEEQSDLLEAHKEANKLVMTQQEKLENLSVLAIEENFTFA